MLNKETIIKVTNRDSGSVGYTIPDLQLHRKFQAGEVKELTMDELRKLSYVPGGLNILKKYLVLDNEEAIAELITGVEPEYYYSEKEILKLLEQGSLAEFEDCLDFAPEGTLNLVKKLAIETKLNDVAKRKALSAKLGVNISAAIEANEMTADDEEVVEQKQRRVATPTILEEKPAERRVTPTTNSNYKIISTKK